MENDEKLLKLSWNKDNSSKTNKNFNSYIEMLVQ